MLSLLKSKEPVRLVVGLLNRNQNLCREGRCDDHGVVGEMESKEEGREGEREREIYCTWWAITAFVCTHTKLIIINYYGAHDKHMHMQCHRRVIIGCYLYIDLKKIVQLTVLPTRSLNPRQTWSKMWSKKGMQNKVMLIPPSLLNTDQSQLSHLKCTFSPNFLFIFFTNMVITTLTM